MSIKNSCSLVLATTIALSSTATFAQSVKLKYPMVYPFIPESKEAIYNDVKRVSEDVNFFRNFNDIVNSGLSEKYTSEQPWSGSYWPLSKGTIADPYEKSDFSYFVDINWLTWENNYKGFKKRMVEKLSKVDSMTEEELAKLAPSEKYDLLLGDKQFDLTARLWEYMNKWGSQKESAFIKDQGIILAGEDSLDLANDYIAKNWYKDVDDAFQRSPNLKVTLAAEKALELVSQGKYRDAASAFGEASNWAKAEDDNYVLEKKNSRIAVWEGICNGWSTAAGLVPRPRKAVSFRLPDGRNLKFFPEDIKGIISLFYVNSLIQDPATIGDNGMPITQGTVSAGLRCNLSNPKRDIWGRFYDDKVDPTSTTGVREARCSGVHPATWHMGLVNLIGKQDRSFVVERKVGAAVDNHPMYGYKFKYFNPLSGSVEKNLNKNIERIDEQDQFRQFRNKAARFIVGVETTVTYMNYHKPNRKEVDVEKEDTKVEHTMMYDLELDDGYNIVGGQWRALRTGQVPEESSIARTKLNQNQPNFFWAVSRNYKKTGWFDDDKSLSTWTNKRLAPPANWLTKAKTYHDYKYLNLVEYGNADTCRMKNKKTGKYKTVYCELEINRPQPLVNVVNALVELSSGK